PQPETQHAAERDPRREDPHRPGAPARGEVVRRQRLRGPAECRAAPPTSARAMSRPAKLPANPLASVQALHSSTPPVMTPRRERRSPSRPNGSAARAKTSTYEEASQPSWASERCRSRLIGSKRAKTILRLTKLSR